MTTTTGERALHEPPSSSERELGRLADVARRRSLLRRLLRNRKGLLGGIGVVILIGLAIFGPWLVPQDPNAIDPLHQLGRPSASHWFGTDELGRDIFSRVLIGARPAMLAGLLAVSIAGIIGTVTGIAAGYLGGALDAIVMRVWDALLAFPAIFLAIGIVAILGPGWINAVLAIAVINMPIFARIVRSATLTTASRDFIEAARAIGSSNWRIMAVHVLPNVAAPALVVMAVAVPDAILVEASLSFLGLGSQPPAASWGNMLSSAQAYLFRSATYALFPGLAITFAVLSMNFLADGIQDALNPVHSPSRGG